MMGAVGPVAVPPSGGTGTERAPAGGTPYGGLRPPPSLRDIRESHQLGRPRSAGHRTNESIIGRDHHSAQV